MSLAGGEMPIDNNVRKLVMATAATESVHTQQQFAFLGMTAEELVACRLSLEKTIKMSSELLKMITG